MDEYELEQLSRQPKWVAVLEHYHQQHLVQRDQSKEFDGWVSRIHDVSKVPTEELPGIHGKLIAFGFLKFDLAGRDGGMRYQLTPLARQAVSASNESKTEDVSAESAETEGLALLS